MKKIYFACSIRGGRNDSKLYAQIVDSIKQHARVLTEIFADGQLTAQGMDKPVKEIWKSDMAWVTEADAIIAEVTNPSLGVGYEIAKAEGMNKPILCLYRPQMDRKLSAMIAGSPKVTVFEYRDIKETEEIVINFVKQLHL